MSSLQDLDTLLARMSPVQKYHYRLQVDALNRSNHHRYNT